jgi:hypothetical protein
LASAKPVQKSALFGHFRKSNGKKFGKKVKNLRKISEKIEKTRFFAFFARFFFFVFLTKQ